jgi:mono/diheme cytochrome c family protein
MLRKILKWTLFSVVFLIVILALSFFIMKTVAEGQIRKKYDIQPEAIVLPDDSASLERGRQRAAVLCLDCHGEGFGGKEFFNDPQLGRMDSPNLTSGEGGIGGDYTVTDWVRAIRHGVNRDGRALMVMPSADFHSLSRQDLSEVVAYIMSIPPVDRQVQTEASFTAMAKVLMTAGAFGTVFGADEIDHKAGYSTAPDPGPTAVYGEYLVKVFGCRHCHGDMLNGGKSPDPASPFCPNITPGGNLGRWTEPQFISAMRTGTTPEGHQMTDFMPWKATANMNDMELQALHQYLNSLPRLESTKK